MSGEIAASPSKEGRDATQKDQLSRYVAYHVRQLYEERQGTPLDGVHVRRREFGVVALADISGYSTLTAHLSQRGNVGAELLTSLLNPYFHFVIDILEKSGADVVKFIGDAMLVTWEQKDSTPTETLVSAVNGCLKLLDRLGSHQLSIPNEDKTFPLSIHIGLGVGLVHDIHVGSARHQRWDYYLAGTAAAEAVELVNVAQKRQLAISKSAIRILAQEPSLEVTFAELNEHGAIIQSLSSQNSGMSKYLLSTREAPQNPPPKPVYKHYINESARLRLEAALTTPGLVNELRLVSIVFVQLGGFDPHVDSSFALQQEAMTAVLGVLRTYEGTLRQMVIDDKGITILTVFGLPPWSHENDSLFGVRGALEMRKVLAPIVPQTSIAVTTGTVFTGIVGGRTRSDHTVMGEAVNLAARIMVAAECCDRVLCDQATYDATKGDVDLEDQGQPTRFMTKKGEAVVYKVAGIRRNEAVKLKSAVAAAAPANTALIGREAETEMAVQALRSFIAHKAAPKLLIEGMGGSGKSALNKTVLAEATRAGVHVCSGKGDEVDQSTPFYVYRDIVATLVDLILDHTQDLVKDEGGNVMRSPSTQELPKAPSSSQLPAVNLPRSPTAARRRPSAGAVDTDAVAGVPDLTALSASKYKATVRALSNTGRSRSLYQSMRITGVGAGELIVKQLDESARRTQGRQPSKQLGGDDGVPTQTPDALSSPLGDAMAAEERGEDEEEMIDRFKDDPMLARDDATELLGRAILERAGQALQRIGMQRHLAGLLAPIYGIREEGSKRYAGNVAADRAEPMIDLLAKIINKVTCPPLPVPMNEGVLISIDDGHWVDSLSWMLTWKLARRCPRVMIVITHRTASSPTEAATMARVRALPAAIHISLEGLSREAVSRLLCFRMGDSARTVNDKLLDQIMQKTGGNPLFVEYMFRAMQERKLLMVSPTLELTSRQRQDYQTDVEDHMPKDLQSAMLVQFDRLSPDVQLILRVASVIGQHFSLETVAEINGRFTAEECYEKITTGEATAFVSPELDEGGDSTKYSMYFRSAMLQSCVYSTMLYGQREKIHKQVAESYESFLNDNTRNQLLLLIHFHYERTNEVTKRLHYMEAVAQHHLAHQCLQDAITTLHKLLTVFKSLDPERQAAYTNHRQSVWYKLLGQAYVQRNLWTTGREYLFEALQLVNYALPERASSVRSAINKQLKKQKDYFDRRHRAASGSASNSGKKSKMSTESVKHLVETLQILSEALTYLGDMDRSTLCTLLIVNHCDMLGEEACQRAGIPFGRAEAATGHLMLMRGNRSLAFEYYERAERLAASSDVHERVSVFLLEATSRFSLGELTAVRQLLDRCQTILDNQAMNLNNGGLGLLRLTVDLLDGQFERVRHLASQMFEHAQDAGQEGFASMYAAVIAFALLACPPVGPVHGAADVHNWIRAVEASLETWQEANNTALVLLHLGALTCFYLFSNDSLKVSTLLSSILALLPKISHGALSSLPAATGLLFVAYGLFQWMDENNPRPAQSPISASSSSVSARAAELGAGGSRHSMDSVRSNISLARKNATLARVEPQQGGLIMLDKKALVSIVRSARSVLETMRKTWVPLGALADMYRALKVLLQDQFDRAVTVLEDGANAVPDNMRFVKTVLLVRSLSFHARPSGRKERERLEKRIAELRSFLALTDDLRAQMNRLDQASAMLH